LRPAGEPTVTGKVVVLVTPAPVTHRTAEENLGLGYLAATLRVAGRQVRVIDAWLEGLTAAEMATRVIAGPAPLLVGFSCYRSNMAAAIDTATAVRAALGAVPVIAGGYGPTFHPAEFIQAGFDVAVRGEAEQTLVDLAVHYATGSPALDEIPGITYRTPAGVAATPARRAIADLDRLPVPARDTLPLTLARRSPAHVQSSRGCRGACTFCSIAAFERLGGHRWRQRSLQSLITELASLADRGVRHVKLVDDSLIEPPRDAAWCADLADELASRGLALQLRGQIRADLVTPQVVAHLRRAGFWSFACGIENFAPTALARMAKHADVDANLAALETFRVAGIVVQAGHILFDHATTWDELNVNYEQLRRHPWTVSKGIFTEMYAAAGTVYARQLHRRGLLADGPAAVGTAGLGNATYPIADPAARTVHVGLKRWHRDHARLLDMVIDPLTAPKAIEPEHRSEFLELSTSLRRLDLDVLEGLLALTAHTPDPGRAIEYVDTQIVATAAEHARIAARAAHAYRRTGLIYDADDNPFLA
jgi:anaerobic magnesium-protoporphyrin IX monomethyl ester cyclase